MGHGGQQRTGAAVAAVLLLLLRPAAAAPLPSRPANGAQIPAAEAPLAAFWAWQRAEALGGGAAAAPSLAALTDGLFVAGWPGLQGAGCACARLAGEAAATGHLPQADAYAAMARRLAPHHLDAHVAALGAAWRQGFWPGAIAALRLLAALAEPVPRRAALGSYLAVLMGWGAVLAASLGAASALWSARRRCRLALSALAPARAPNLPKLAAWGVGTVALALGLGPWAYACACAALAAPLLRRRRRLLLGAALLLPLCYWLVLPNFTPALAPVHADNVLRHAALYDADAADLHLRLERRGDADVRDRWARGLRWSYGGAPAVALAHLEQVQQSGVQDADLWCALGVSHWRLHHAQAARSAFLEALALAPEHVAAIYNLGVLELAAARPELALQRRQRAFAFGPDQVLAMANLAVTEVMDPMPPAALWQQQADAAASAAGVEAAWGFLGGRIGLKGSVLLGFWACLWTFATPWRHLRGWPALAAKLNAESSGSKNLPHAQRWARYAGILLPGSLGIASGRGLQAYAGLWMLCMGVVGLGQCAGLFAAMLPIDGVDFFALQRPVWLALHAVLATAGLVCAYASGGWEDA